MVNKKLLVEGKTNNVYEIEDGKVIIEYKDTAKAYSGVKVANIKGKGIITNKISEIIMKYLSSNGVKTHFIERISDRNQICHYVKVLPFKIICRNYVAGSIAKRYGIKEGFKLHSELIEYYYDNVNLSHPYLSYDQAIAFGYSSEEILKEVDATVRKVNKLLIDLFDKIGITFVDFKLELGFDSKGDLIVCDELSPDTVRLWDKETNECYDRDRFRKDLGRIAESYQIVLEKLEKMGV